jgi:hypothetical protein
VTSVTLSATLIGRVAKESELLYSYIRLVKIEKYQGKRTDRRYDSVSTTRSAQKFDYLGR